MKPKNQQPTCVPLWKRVETQDHDQAVDPSEGVSALFELRRLGALPPEPLPLEEPSFESWAELCF